VDRVLKVIKGDKWWEFLTRTESGYDATVTDEIVVREMFLENVYQVSEGDFADLGVVVDIGGNIGAFSVLATALGATSVHTFEPDSLNWEVLVANIAVNKLGDVIHPHKVGVARDRGEAVLLQGQGASFIQGVKGLTPEAARRAAVAETETIQTISLREALDEAGWGCDVLKFDCEGSEYEILAGATADDLKRAAYIVMEFHPADGETFGRMISKLTLTHNIHIIGRHDVGGQIYARRY
jgi:FkbM family methyltransferase